MKGFLEGLAKLPEAALLGVNLGLAGFVALAHGGALLLVLSEKVPAPPGYAEMVRRLAPITLSLAGATLLSGTAALLWRSARPLVLQAQAVVVFASGVALLAWSTGVLLQGIPPGNFAWTPGMLTGWMAYSCLSAGRFLVPASWPTVRLYAPLAGMAVACPVDLGVFARLLAWISTAVSFPNIDSF